MATLVFTAVGTALGGPLGGAIGSLVGNQLDRAIASGGRREGPRLKELAVTTSSYGAAIPRQHGTMRAPGTIIWSTDIIEQSEETGGGKGSPSGTNYSYSASFAVALSSRPIRSVRRIWADGNLLRGAGGDLKTGGTLRIYEGRGDQDVDTLIGSAEGGACPAFRGLAYCVFESLQLGDFGNRIPALTFEVVADNGTIRLTEMIGELGVAVESNVKLGGLVGFSDEGGATAGLLDCLTRVYPMACDTGGHGLTIAKSDQVPAVVPVLPEAARALNDSEAFAKETGQAKRRKPDAREIPDGLRYYDTSRDYQPGLQRADGRARPGRSQIIEVPGAFAAKSARTLVNAAAERAGWAREVVAWRMAELDPSLGPGAIVRVPGKAGYWLIESWEWRELGIELELRRLPRGPGRQPVADAGTALVAPDQTITPTILRAYEAPWQGNGVTAMRQVFAAATSESPGWRGARLFIQQDNELVPLSATVNRRAILGETVTIVPPSQSNLIDRHGTIDIRLASEDLALRGSTIAGLAKGENMALIGGEVIQFTGATASGGGTWRLEGMLRGRGGTEAQAIAGHPAGTTFVLLDDKPVMLAPESVGSSSILLAQGLGDPEPIEAQIENPGLSTRPLTPVHPRAIKQPDGSLSLRWCRRARGAWAWLDQVDTPINEESEAYQVGLGPVDSPAVLWTTDRPSLDLSADTITELSARHDGQAIWVRQVGTVALSPALHLFALN